MFNFNPSIWEAEAGGSKIEASWTPKFQDTQNYSEEHAITGLYAKPQAQVFFFFFFFLKKYYFKIKYVLKTTIKVNFYNSVTPNLYMLSMNYYSAKGSLWSSVASLIDISSPQTHNTTTANPGASEAIMVWTFTWYLESLSCLPSPKCRTDHITRSGTQALA